MAGPLFGTSPDARIWLCLDCCGLSCACASQGIILSSMYAVSKDLWTHGSGLGASLHVLLFNAVGLLASASHLRAMLSDPGAVPKRATPLARDEERARLAASAANGYRTRAKGWCHRCGCYKPPRAHHDSVTNRCIVKMDHYCPWTNNAIGVKNHKFFILFILYTFLLCSYALVILFSLALHAGPRPYRSGRRRHGDLAAQVAETGEPSALPRFEVAKLSTIAVTFAALLFGLFTACMLGDQWSVLRTNVAKIDRLKGEETECASDVNEVFGGRSRGFRVDWLVPTKPLFPASVHDDIMGYHLANGLDDDLEANDVEAAADGADQGDEKTELPYDHLGPASASKPKPSDEVRSRAKPTVV